MACSASQPADFVNVWIYFFPLFSPLSGCHVFALFFYFQGRDYCWDFFWSRHMRSLNQFWFVLWMRHLTTAVWGFIIFVYMLYLIIFGFLPNISLIFVLLCSSWVFLHLQLVKKVWIHHHGVDRAAGSSVPHLLFYMVGMLSMSGSGTCIWA